MAFCGLVGLIAWRRCGGPYRAMAAACAAGGMALPMALDRPYLFTFLLLAATIAVLEFRRWIWLLPALFLFWANCHGGFFLGWIVLGAYCAESLWRREGDRRLLVVSALAVLVSGVNPNGFGIVQVLLYYRSSAMTANLLEWRHPQWLAWNEFTLLWMGGLAALVWARRQVRPADALLFMAFLAAAFSAQRNVILVGLIGPIVIVTYVPWKRTIATAIPFALSLAALGAMIAVSAGNFFQFRAAEWRYPRGASDFLLAHHIAGPMFNTYEYGGYLIWRLWPQERVFIDGRALSESLFQQYGRILYNVEDSNGEGAGQLLNRYGIDTIVMNTFEYGEGLVYKLAPALSDPTQKDWKLVYDDPAAIVLMRHPPPDVEPLDPLRILSHMEAECQLHLDHEPRLTECARALSGVFNTIGDRTRAQRWAGVYVEGAR